MIRRLVPSLGPAAVLFLTVISSLGFDVGGLGCVVGLPVLFIWFRTVLVLCFVFFRFVFFVFGVLSRVRSAR